MAVPNSDQQSLQKADKDPQHQFHLDCDNNSKLTNTT